MKLAGEMIDFFGQAHYGDLRIDLVDLLHPFSNAFFTIRKEGSLTQIRPRALGSGVEIILTLLLLRSMASDAKGGIVYLLDEPELHLHPKAQQKLAELLLDEAIHKQIVVSTHSPYLLRSFMDPSVNKTVLRRDEKNQVQVEDAGAANWGMFPWSPSWGEVNFVAYDLATMDYHNELYGWLQERHSLPGENEVERYLVTRGVAKTKQWQRLKGGQPEPPYAVTLCTYVRHSIHHPENTLNSRFTESELRDSIGTLREVV